MSGGGSTHCGGGSTGVPAWSTCHYRVLCDNGANPSAIDRINGASIGEFTQRFVGLLTEVRVNFVRFADRWRLDSFVEDEANEWSRIMVADS